MRQLFLWQCITLCAFVLHIACSDLKAQSYLPVIELTEQSTVMDVTTKMEIFEDAGGQNQIEDVIRDNVVFKINDQAMPNFGFTKSAYWVRFVVRSSSEAHWFLHLDFPLMDELVIYRLSNGLPEPIRITGRMREFSSRDIPHRTFAVHLPLHAGSTDTLYARFRTDDTMTLPLYLIRADIFRERDHTQQFGFGLYYGIMLVMALYNVFIFLKLRDRSYLYYVLYIASFGMLLMYQNGISYELFPWAQWRMDPFWSSMASLWGIQFSRHYLLSHRFTPRLDRVLKILLMMSVVSVVISVVAPYRFSIWPGVVIGILIFPLMISTAIIAIRKNYTPGKIFLTAWIVLLTGIVLNAFMSMGLLPANDFTLYGIQVGSALETVLLSLGLANRISVLKHEKEEAEKKLVETELRMKAAVVQQLEEKVRERTALLEAQKQELAQTLEVLKNTEVQLVQTAKMSALGQLIAGVAHEINNPITFIYSNLYPLEDYIEQFKQLAKAAIEHGLHTQLQDEGVNKKLNNLDELFDDSDRILKSFRLGTQRIRNIVQDLQKFEHADESEKIPVDMNDEIRSVLKLITPQYRDQIEINTQWGPIPEFYCTPSHFHQIFMDIFINAAQAIIQRNKDDKRPKGNLHVATYVDESQAWIGIDIRDDGTGIAQEHITKIFDPFFTTKPVGEGTGLGLAIAYRLIEKNRGTIQVQSKVRDFTQFTIRLPINSLIKE
ncbi:MAG TPA: 7TM diverse intracellular signaling domain-containing protein [bacterium]|nr:7TM diverse intracellular signaling domain-containing protein [bacterium]